MRPCQAMDLAMMWRAPPVACSDGKEPAAKTPQEADRKGKPRRGCNAAGVPASIYRSESEVGRTLLLRGDLGHVRRLFSLGAVNDFELDLLPLAQRSETCALNGGIMDKNVITISALDETV